MSVADVTLKVAIGSPAAALPGTVVGWFALIGGTVMCSTNVSIQNVALISTALALGFVAFGSPSRNAMLAVPPPKSGSAGTSGEGRVVSTVMLVVDAMLWLSTRVCSLDVVVWKR